MTTTAGTRNQAGYIPELDGLRAIAILLVIVFHSRTIADAATDGQQFFMRLAETGWVGVDLFFVLSGFLITGILIDTAGRPGYFRSFYIRRVLRIFPLYYAALAAFAIGFHVFGIERLAPVSTTAEVAHWVYLQNWLPLFGVDWTRPLAHFWSLGVEEQFYLCWPALVLLFARRGRVAQLCIGTIAFAVVMRVVFWWAGVSEAGNFATVTRIDTLAIGGYLACLQRGTGWARLAPDASRGLGPWLPAVLVASALMTLGVALWGGSFFRPTNPHIFLFGYLPLAILFGATVAFALVAGQTSLWRRLLRCRPLTEIGKISYGIYVIHWPLVLALQPIWPESVGGFWVRQATFLLVILAGSFTLAALSFALFESRFLNLKDRLAARPGSPPHQHTGHALNQKAQ
ncbi:MAG: acyltransferase [Acidobacteria bacterium]|nr:acyltransferase [Acidobacteriota bacterium]